MRNLTLVALCLRACLLLGLAFCYSCTKSPKKTQPEWDTLHALLLESDSLRKTNPEKALGKLKEANILAKTINSTYGQASCALLISKVYFSENRIDSALFYDSLSITLAQSTDSTQLEFDAHLLYAMDLTESSRYQEARTHFDVAARLGEVANLPNLPVVWIEKSRLDQRELLFDSALIHLKKAKTGAEERHQEIRQAQISMRMGQIAMEMGNFGEALEKFLEAAAIRERLQDETGLAESYISLAIVYAESNNPQLKLQYDRKALELVQKHHLVRDEAKVLANIGLTFIGLKRLDSALFYMTKGLEKHREAGDRNGVRVDCSNMGYVFMELKQFDSAEFYLYKSLSLCDTAYPDIELASVYDNLGRLFVHKNQLLLAEKYFLKALQFTRGYGYKDAIYTLRELPDLYQKLGRIEEAFRYQQEYILYKDSLFNEDTDRQILRLTAQYEIDKKEAALQLVEKDKELLKVKVDEGEKSLALLAVVCLLLAVLLFTIFSSLRRKNGYAKNLEQKNEQIQNLMLEMHHRVKNNFQALSHLFTLQVQQSDAEDENLKANKVRVDALLLHHQQLSSNYSLKDTDLVSYMDELVENVVFQFGYPSECIEKDYRISSCLIDVDKLLPVGLIVNEAVTNACKHAFPTVEIPKLKITIDQREGGLIYLCIQDNGMAGMEKKEAKKSFGLNLMDIFAKQLNAQIEQTYDMGLTWCIYFHPDGKEQS